MAVTKTSVYRLNVLCYRPGVRHYCNTQEGDNKPVKFSTSEAANWRAEFTRSGNIYDESPDAQPFVISISTAIFFYYFFIYREESDIDEMFDLTRNIYDRVDGLEEVQLNLLKQKKLDKGEDVTEIDRRLNFLISERLAKETKSNSSDP